MIAMSWQKNFDVVRVENWEESVVILTCISCSWMMLDDNIFIKFRCFHCI